MGTLTNDGDLSERLLPEKEGGVRPWAPVFSDPNHLPSQVTKSDCAHKQDHSKIARKQTAMIVFDLVMGAYSIAVALAFTIQFTKDWTVVPIKPGSNNTALVRITDSSACGHALVLDTFSVPVVAWANCILHIVLKLVVVLLMSQHLADTMKRNGYPGSKLLNSGKIDVSPFYTMSTLRQLSDSDTWKEHFHVHNLCIQFTLSNFDGNPHVYMYDGRVDMWQKRSRKTCILVAGMGMAMGYGIFPDKIGIQCGSA